MSAASVHTLEGGFTVHELRATDLIPPAVFRTSFYWIGKTRQSLSLVCADHLELGSTQSSPGWRCLQINTTAKESPTEQLAALARVLQQADVRCITLLAADGAYGLVPERHHYIAEQALLQAGYLLKGL